LSRKTRLKPENSYSNHWSTEIAGIIQRFLNKKLKKRFEELNVTTYPKYDNYDAIEVPFTECIPSDYNGAMGVPITFITRYCPEQFEIIWQASGNAYANAPKEVIQELKFDPTIKYGGGLGAPVLQGKATYARIMIRPKKGADT